MLPDDDPPEDDPAQVPDEIEPDSPVDKDRRDNARRESQARRIKREAKEGEAFWRDALASPVGRRELWALLGDLSTFRERYATSPNGGSAPEKQDYWRGQRDAGLALWRKLMRLDAQNVLLMHTEHDPEVAQPKKRGS